MISKITLASRWEHLCQSYATFPADFYAGNRKILTNLSWTLPLEGDFKLEQCGYTKTKIAMLKRLYYNQEHTDEVKKLWQLRVKQGKYGSVGLSTYHHLTKNDPNKPRGRGSLMGPCLMGVTLTLLNKDKYKVDVFYRTTELFKKYPADLIFLKEIILPEFDIPLDSPVNFHMANVTIHPMYFLNYAVNRDVIYQLNQIRKVDNKFFWYCVKWCSNYLLPERQKAISKFAQAVRVMEDVNGRIRNKQAVIAYLREYQGNNQTIEEEEDDE